jgi:importin subunit alpha-1
LAVASLGTDDNSILMDGMWAIGNILDTKDNEFIKKEVQERGLVAEIVKLVGKKDPSIYTVAVRCIGHIFTVPGPFFISEAIDCDLLGCFQSLFHTGNAAVIKEILWVISNMCAGSSCDVAKIVKHSIFEKIMIMSEHTSLDLKKEAMYVITNSIIIADAVTKEKILEIDD